MGFQKIAARSCHVIGITGIGAASAAAMTGAQAAPPTEPAQPIADVIVTGQRTKLDPMTEKVLNTPQSINIVPAKIIQEQGLSSLTDALRNVPGITLNAGEGGTHGDLVNLRGFSAGDDYFLDGLRDTGLYDRDTFNVEALEVVKGPASTLFGRGSTGGVVNQVSKSPTLDNFANASVTFEDDDYDARGTVDANYRFADNAAVRIAAMFARYDTAGRPFIRGKRWGVAPSIAFGLVSDTHLTLKYLHQHEDNLPDYGIPFVFGKPAPVARDTYYGLPADDKFATDVDVVTGRFEHRFNGMFSFANTARYGRYTFDSRQTAPAYGNANCYAVSPYAGAPDCATTANPVPVTAFNPLYPVLGTPLNRIFVERDRPSSTGKITTMMNSAALTAKFDTGLLAHTVVTGVELDSEDAALVRFTNQNTVILPTLLLNPDPDQAFPGHQTTIRQLPTTKTKTIGAYIVDTIHIGTHWDVIGAVRFDHFTATFDQPLGTAAHFKHTDNVTSPRAALVYKPNDASSVYFSYGTSFNPSAENLSLAANNQALDPEEDRTFEVGGKWEILNRHLALSAAAFNTEMTNARITDPLTPSLQTLAGTLKVNGVEFNATGYLTPAWEITAGYTYLEPEATGLVAAGVKGPIPNTTHHQANLWTTYDFDLGITVGTGVNFVGEREAGSDTLTIPGTLLVATLPSYVTWDAMVGFKINDHLRAQFNVQNLTDEFYYANSYFTRPGENHTIPGAGRTVVFSAVVSY